MSYYDEEEPDYYLSQEEVEEIQEEYRKKRLVEALIGPSISTGFHIMLIILLAIFIEDKLKEVKSDIEVKILPEEEVIDIPPPPEPPEKEPEVDVVVKDALSVPNPEPDIDEKALENTEIPDPTSIDNTDFEEVSAIEVSPSSFIDPRIRGANSKGGKTGKAREYGVDERTVTSFDLSLMWLAKVQNADGSWGTDAKSGYTGLALLTFLANGETPTSRRYGKHVLKAMKWLIEDKIDTKSHHAYPHAIKAYALAEAYAMTGNSQLREKMNESIEVIIKGQQEGGAFDYNYKANENRQDLSFSGWNYQALKAADIAGCEVDGLQEAIYKSIEYLKLMGGSERSYAYTTSNSDPDSGKGSGKWTMKAVGTLCLQLLEPGNHAILNDELESMLKEGVNRFDWNKAPKRSLYGWYYETNAMFHAQGKYWRGWRKKFAKEIMANQHREGYWVYPGDNHMPGDDLSKKVYATTLCALMLSVPFRYLPSSKVVNSEKVKESKRKPGGVVVEEGIDLIE